MTLGDIATAARFLSNTDTVNYTDAQLLIFINFWYQKVADMILSSQDNSDFDDMRIGAGGSAGSSGNYPIVTTPMVANQRDYTIPVSERMLKFKRCDITWNGVDWYRAEPFDSGTFPFGIGFDNATPVDANFDSNFIRERPRYDVAYNSVWIAPMPVAADVSAGGTIRMEWERNIIPFTTADYTSVLTDSTQVPGFDAPFHPILAYGAAYEYAVTRQLPQLKQIQDALVDWEARLRLAYGRKDLDMRINLQTGYDDSFGR